MMRVCGRVAQGCVTFDSEQGSPSTKAVQVLLGFVLASSEPPPNLLYVRMGPERPSRPGRQSMGGGWGECFLQEVERW